MPAEMVVQAEGRWARVDRAVKEGILAGEILLESKLKTDYLSGDPVHRRKGNLSRAVFHEPKSISGFTEYRGFVGVGREAPYAIFVNDGTDPYIIRPKKAGGVLRFEVGGKVIYAREVHHRGIDPKQFMERALKDNADAIVNGIGSRVNSALTTAK